MVFWGSRSNCYYVTTLMLLTPNSGCSHNHMSNILLYPLNLISQNDFQIELKNLPNLEHLLLNNNSLSGMEAIELEKLPQLTVLNMDSNKISKIGQKDLMALSGSRKLASLSLSENAIAEIECRSFAPVSSLLVLSLQSNNITSLSCKLPSPKQETSKRMF